MKIKRRIGIQLFAKNMYIQMNHQKHSIQQNLSNGDMTMMKCHQNKYITINDIPESTG